MGAIIGWISWVFVFYLAVTFAHSCRSWKRAGKSFMWPTAVFTFFVWVIAIVFLFSGFNKLHIIWITPVSFFLSTFLVTGGVPIISPIVMMLTKIFLEIILLGAKESKTVESSNEAH